MMLASVFSRFIPFFLAPLSLSVQLFGNVDEDLVTRIPMQKNAEPESCCNEDNLLTCESVNVDPAMLMNSQDDLTILGIRFTFSNHIEPHGFVYKTKVGDEAIITYREASGNMFGSVKTREGRSFAIEKCKGGHVVKEYDIASFPGDIGVVSPEDVVNAGRRVTYDSSDNTTVVNYSIMLYYTPEVQANVADLDGFFDQVLAETNQGYEQSSIPVRLTKFCTELATINDMPNASASSEVLYAFRAMKGSDAALRNTADAAALITWSLPGCGVAFTYTYANGLTLSVTKKSCATGYYSFGHELGHNFGCQHNPEASSNTMFDHGHGHLIEAGTASTGARTILAYNAEGHAQRVNYYSNPSVIYPPTGTATGVMGLSNNAAVITANRWSFASLGDETAVCFGTASTTTTATTSSSTTTSTTTTSTTTSSTSTTSTITSSTTTTAPTTTTTTTTPSTTTTTPLTTTTAQASTSTTETTTSTTSTTTTTASTESCHPGTIPFLGRPFLREKLTSWELCRDLCNATSECEYWRFKDNQKPKRRMCYLQKVEFKTRNGFDSGEKYCTL